MKKGLIYLLLFFSLTVQAQLPGIVASAGVSSGGYCAEYQTYYNTLPVKPGADTANAQNTLIVELKAAGAFQIWHVFYITAQRTEAGALINVIAPGTHNASNVSSTAFTMYEGFTGDGTADYINTNWNPSTDSIPYRRNSASIGIYLRNDKDENKKILDQGSAANLVPEATGASYARINSGSVDSWSNTVSGGLLVLNRSSQSIITLYVNGGTKGNVTKTSAAMANANMNFVGAPAWTEYGTRQVAIFFAGDSMDATMQTAVNTAIEKYLDAIGKGVE